MLLITYRTDPLRIKTNVRHLYTDVNPITVFGKKRQIFNYMLTVELGFFGKAEVAIIQCAKSL